MTGFVCWLDGQYWSSAPLVEASGIGMLVHTHVCRAVATPELVARLSASGSEPHVKNIRAQMECMRYPYCPWFFHHNMVLWPW
jgi:hypothetical protein